LDELKQKHFPMADLNFEFILKGTVSRDFSTFVSNNSICALDSHVEAFSNMVRNPRDVRL
jgi:hypothetical protein